MICRDFVILQVCRHWLACSAAV